MTEFDLPIRRQDPIRMRNYGRIIQDMVAYAVSLTDTFQRQNMTIFVARCMRQKNATWNKALCRGFHWSLKFGRYRKCYKLTKEFREL